MMSVKKVLTCLLVHPLHHPSKVYESYSSEPVLLDLAFFERLVVMIVQDTLLLSAVHLTHLSVQTLSDRRRGFLYLHAVPKAKA